MKHEHHIIPRYLNSVCPLAELTISLTVEQHAEAHRILWQEYGNKQDYLAWKGLLSYYSKEDIISEILSENGKKTIHYAIKAVGNKYSEETNSRRSEAMIGVKKTLEHREAISKGKKGKPFSDEHRKKLSEAAKRRKVHGGSAQFRKKK